MLSYDPISDFIENEHRIACVIEFLSDLTPRQREVIKFRWGYVLGFYDKKLYIEEIENIMGISGMRIYQTERDAFRKFKQRMKVDKYEEL